MLKLLTSTVQLFLTKLYISKSKEFAGNVIHSRCRITKSIMYS